MVRRSPEKSCPSCGFVVGEGMQFCPHCGMSLAPKTGGYQCRNCGTRVTASAQFCRSCGQALAAAPESIATSQGQSSRWKGVLFLVVIVGGIGAIGTLDDDSKQKSAALPTVTIPYMTATASPTLAQLKASYPSLPDVREIIARPSSYQDRKWSFSGEVLTVHEAGPGKVYKLGDDDSYETRAFLQVTIRAPGGEEEPVIVGYDKSTVGIFENSDVTVYATLRGTDTFKNAFGAEVTQPLFIADMIDVSGSTSTTS